jgi:DNA-binding NarL/FixJ family response regulator
MANDSVFKILVFEDIPGESEIIQHELRKSKVPLLCQTASNKNDFMEKMTAFQPDLVVSDDSNKELNGKDIISAVREQSHDAKLIIVTIDYDYDKIVEYFAFGADNCILYDHIVFLSSIVKQLYLYKLENSLPNNKIPHSIWPTKSCEEGSQFDEAPL